MGMTKPNDTQAPERIGTTIGVDFGTGKDTTMLTLMIDGKLDRASTDGPWGQAILALLAERDLADARAAAAWQAGIDALLDKVGDLPISEIAADEVIYGAKQLTPPADASTALDALIAERVREAVAYAREAIIHASNNLSTHLEQYHDHEEETPEGRGQGFESLRVRQSHQTLSASQPKNAADLAQLPAQDRPESTFAVRHPIPEDWDRWTPNISAWSNWTGSVTLDDKCPIGRTSCVIKLGSEWDDCPYFMGVRDFESTKACCGYLLNKDEADA